MAWLHGDLSAFLGYPFLPILISKHAVRRQRTVVLLVMLPMWMNFLIRTYSWMTILGDSGVINSFFDRRGAGAGQADQHRRCCNIGYGL